MALFAKIENNIVTQVIVAEKDFIDAKILTGDWIQSSNNAGIGYCYDKELNIFYPPQPFKSWTLNKETGEWESPVVRPLSKTNEMYTWNEKTQNWFIRNPLMK